MKWVKPARNAAFMRQRHGNCENLPAKAGVPGQDRLGDGVDGALVQANRPNSVLAPGQGAGHSGRMSSRRMNPGAHRGLASTPTSG